MAERVLDLVRGRADQAEVYAYDSSSTPVDFESNRLKSLETKDSRGVALRVIKNGRVGLASTTGMGDLRGLADTAVELSAFGAEAKFELPARIEAAPVEGFDLATEQLGVERMAALGQEMIDRVLAYDSAILCSAGVRRTMATTEIMNSRGGHGSYRQSSYSVSIGGQLIRGEDFLSIYEFDTSIRPDVNEQELAEKAIRKFDLAKNVVSIATRRMPVVFNPRGVAWHLVGPLTVALSGKTVLQGSSALSDKLGQAAFDPRLSVYDDSTQPGVPGSVPFDDEGVKTRRTALIERGTVASFYYDLQTAGLAGTQSTGNGYRSPATLPSPSTGVTMIEPGETPLDQLIGGIEEGVLVESMTGNAGNIYSGDFSGSVDIGFKIEKGKLTGRIKNSAVAGNVFSDMRKLGGLSSEAEWIGGGLRTPHILFRELQVSTKSA